MKSIVLRHGAFAGIIMSINLAFVALFSHTLGMTVNMVVGYTVMILGFSLIYFAVASLKKQNGGTISFWQGFKTGLLISLIGSAIYALIWVILYNTVLTNFMADYSSHIIAGMHKSGATAAEIDKTVAEMAEWKKMYDNPVINFFMTMFMEPMPVGLIVSAIAAGILRSKTKTLSAG